MIYTQADLDLFCLCIYREARGEGQEGMRAVGHVIMNRVGAIGFSRTLYGAIRGHNQFSSMSVPSDPEYTLQPPPGDLQMAFLVAIAPSILEGTDSDPTLGARYYKVAGAKNDWFDRVIVADTKNHPFTIQINHQVFYK